jgi:hypothetical protein
MHEYSASMSIFITDQYIDLESKYLYSLTIYIYINVSKSNTKKNTEKFD